MPDIRTIKTLNVGTQGLEVTADVVYAGEYKHQEGQYGPYTGQWIALQDLTDKIGVMLNSSIAVRQGQRVTVKGKLGEYDDKEGQPQLKLVGKVINSQQGQQSPPSQQTQQAPKQTYPSNKDRLIVAQVVYKALCDKFGLLDDFDVWFAGNQKIFSRHIESIMRAGREQLNAEDEDIPF